MGAKTRGRRSTDNGTIQRMKASRVGVIAAAAIAAAICLSAPAYADPDTDFDNQLGRFGIYGPHDYNPYLAKIACRRLGQGVDPDAAATAHFLSNNLPRAPRRCRRISSSVPRSASTAPTWRPSCRTFPRTSFSRPARPRSPSGRRLVAASAADPCRSRCPVPRPRRQGSR